MTISISPMPKAQFFDNYGKPLSGGFIWTYEAGTTTLKNTYNSSSLTVPNTNPIVLDSAGRASIWLDGSYKFIIEDTSSGVSGGHGALLYSADNLGASTDALVSTSNLIMGGYPYVDLRFTNGDLSSALSLASSTGKNVLVTMSSNVLSQQLSTPIGVGIKVILGGIINAGSQTLTINGPFEAGRHLALSGSNITFGYGSVAEVFPEWWGASLYTIDNYSAINSAINSLPNGGVISFGNYIHNYSTTLVFKNNIIYKGSGKESAVKGTILKYSGISDAVQVNNPINSQTLANIFVKDLSIFCTTKTTGKASFADIGSTYLIFDNVAMSGNDYDLILDQSELVKISNCEFDSVGTGGIWLVNGEGHTVGASTYYTNQIIIEKNQFNSSIPVTSIGIIDDGGGDHIIQNNNFNALVKHIRVSGCRNIVIAGNEMEGAAGNEQAIYFTTETSKGLAVTPSRTATIRDNMILAGATEYIKFDENSLIYLTITNNIFFVENGGGVPILGMEHVNVVNAFGNISEKIGSGVTVSYQNYADLGFDSPNYCPYNNMNVRSDNGGLATWTSVWEGTGVNMGNSVVTSQWSRNGCNIIASCKIVMGSTVNYGSATDWTFSVPVTEASNTLTLGSVLMIDLNGIQYHGIAYLDPLQAKIKIAGPVIESVNLAPISSVVPFTWSEGCVLYWTICYVGAQNN